MLKKLVSIFKTNSSIELQKNQGIYSPPLPEFFYVDICNFCNLRCRTCPTGQHKEGLSKAKMNKEQYHEILTKVTPYAKQIHLYNWGEPFLNDDIIPIIKMTSRQNIFTVIHSNMTMRDLNDREAEEIVQSGLSFLSVSLDGASQATYEKYRRGGDFERVISNITAIQQAKSRLNIKLPVRWQFLINAFNEHEIDKAKKMAQDLGVIMHFQLMFVHDNDWLSSFHKNKNSGPWPKVIYDKKIPKEVYTNPNTPPSLHKLLPGFCQQPFNWMTINPNGEVMPCCAIYGDQYSVGNILERSLDEIWYGSEYIKCRKFLANYGSKQNTGAVCEILPCCVKQKYIDGLEGLAFADMKIIFNNGICKENNQEWVWISTDAEFNISILKKGLLSFDLILPEGDIHGTTLPMNTMISVNNKNTFNKTIECAGTYNISFQVEKNEKVQLKIANSNYVIPNELLNNGDKRELSLIVDKFQII